MDQNILQQINSYLHTKALERRVTVTLSLKKKFLWWLRPYNTTVQVSQTSSRFKWGVNLGGAPTMRQLTAALNLGINACTIPINPLVPQANISTMLEWARTYELFPTLHSVYHNFPELYGNTAMWDTERVSREAFQWRDMLGPVGHLVIYNEPCSRPNTCIALSALYNQHQGHLVNDVGPGFYDTTYIDHIQGVPAQVGIEWHQRNEPPNYNDLEAQLRRTPYLAHITEASVPSSGNGDNSPETFTPFTQAAYLRYMMLAAFSNPQVASFTYWCLQDHDPVWPHIGLIAEDGTPKPAYDTFKNTAASLTTNETLKTTNGQVTFKAYPGDYQVTVNGKTFNKTLGSGNTAWEITL